MIQTMNHRNAHLKAHVYKIKKVASALFECYFIKA